MAELLVNSTLDAVSVLPLQSLEEDWVKACWDNHFLELLPLPLATENLLQEEGYCVEHLERLHEITILWHETQSDSDVGSVGLWTFLLENNLSHKALIALLTYLIPMEHNKKEFQGQKKEAAFLAATIYLSLIGLPGSRAFKVYSPDLLLRAVDMLKSEAGLGSKKRVTQIGTSSQRSQGQPRKRNRKTTQQASLSSQSCLPEDDMEEDENEDDVDLSPTRIQRIQSLYIRLLTELVTLLVNFSLRESLPTAEHIQKVLASLTRLDNHNFHGCIAVGMPSTKQEAQALGVAGLAFKGLLYLCQPLHGNVTTLTTSTCKYMLPNMLMLLDGNKVCSSQTLPQHLQLGQKHAVTFFRLILREIRKPCLGGIKTLLQHMCMRVPDRAEYRNKTAQAVVSILCDFPDEQYAFMLKWIGVLSRNEKSTVRAFSLEVITLLLNQPMRQLCGLTEEQAALASHAALISQLLARCSDVAGAVRTRAISSFAQCLESGCLYVKKTIQAMITPRSDNPRTQQLVPTPADVVRTVLQAERTVNEGDQHQEVYSNHSDSTKDGADDDQSNSTPASSAVHTSGINQRQTPFCPVEITEALNNSLPDRYGVISMLHRRARDEKVNVRKAALQALHKFILFEAVAVNKEDVDVLCERCRDKALSVRKQALTSLTEVLMQFQNNTVVQSAWLSGVLPMVWDQETSIQDKCLEIVESVLLCNIVPFHRSKNCDHLMTWELLNHISKPESANLRRHLRKVCRLWDREKKLKDSLIKSVFSHTGTSNNQAAWSLLADIATTKVSIDTRVVLLYWNENNLTITSSTGAEVWDNVLLIIGCNAHSLSSNERLKLIGEIKILLLQFNLKPVLISALTSAVQQLSCVDSGENFRGVQEWGRDILLACDQYLSAKVLDGDMSGDVSFDDDRMMCYLYTLGVVALLCPSITPKRVPLLVQSFIAAPCISASGDSSDSISTGTQPSLASQESEVSEEGSQGSQSTPSSQSTQPVSQFRGCKMSDRVRAVAFLTLGKLCLQEKSLAKKCVPAMARELQLSSSDSVRNNIIIILRDLCIRYATLVDPYVSDMATCLRDPAPIVRHQTLELLTGLLQEDFLKWRGSLFFRFILTLLDPHPEISSFAEFCLGFHLLKRHPTMMSLHLLESIFVFNDYDKHNVFNKYKQTERERKLFSLKGKDNQSQRLKLYQFMLEHMEDEHRFQLTAKISQEILGAVVDGVLPFNQDTCELLQDALAILRSKEIKLRSLRSTKSDDAADEMEMADVVMATAKKTLITQVVKRNVMENVIPVVLSLKHLLDKERSPLLKDLMAFLHELMKDYKNEIKDILAADKQLACEVEYDLRMFENQQAGGAGKEPSTPTSSDKLQTPVAENASSAKTSTSGRKPSTPGNARTNTPANAGIGLIVPGTTPKSQTQGEANSATRKAARRTVELIKERRKTAGEQNGRLLSSVRWAENVVTSASTNGTEQELESIEKDKQETPQCPRRPLRAISTPSGLLSNVTFAGESNMTLPLIPPSPIPGRSKSYDLTEEEENEDVNVVFMVPPDAGHPRPREWKVRVKNEEQVEEASQPALVSSPVISRRRRRCQLQTSTS